MEQIDHLGTIITLIHFVFQTQPERIACAPNMVEFHRTQFHRQYERTNAPEAVTCPQCKQTGVFTAARSAHGRRA